MQPNNNDTTVNTINANTNTIIGNTSGNNTTFNNDDRTYTNNQTPRLVIP